MQRLRILVIDDDPAFRSLIMTLLRTDYVVFVAADGEQGFKQASTTPPDLIIVDVQMPKWDGLQTLRAIRRHHHLRRVPVVVMTGDASRETVLAAIQAGANDYVIKTAFAKEDLQRKIRRALGVSEPKPPAAESSAAVPQIVAATNDAVSTVTAERPLLTAVQSTAEAALPDELGDSPDQTAPQSALPEVQAVLDSWE